MFVCSDLCLFVYLAGLFFIHPSIGFVRVCGVAIRLTLASKCTIKEKAHGTVLPVLMLAVSPNTRVCACVWLVSALKERAVGVRSTRMPALPFVSLPLCLCLCARVCVCV